MTTRKRKNHLIYQAHTKKAKKKVCEFCKFTADQHQVIEIRRYFFLVKNIFPYDLWDGCGVINHLMVVPKRHVDTISHFSDEEQKEYLKLLGQYEKNGFSIYARSPGNAIKSVVHQHTHLIELDNKAKRLVIFSKKPRFLVSK